MPPQIFMLKDDNDFLAHLAFLSILKSILTC